MSDHKQEGLDFLAENGKKDGVVTTESGLQYRVIVDGRGNSPKATDVVRVHYAGRLIDGKEFDSSYKRGTPAEFPVNGVIAGWTEALQLMKEGAKWEVYIKSDLGYGDRGYPGAIPGGAALIFEVELIEVL
ncbi:Peptidyl-prolyl cis-trans isomerase [Acanthopleuribacter pedis]|uniref:Peptidyl-prolyl cis-trans isomerase n=1 Tax=Acanthopleuribacter pedis TaxID=442870 RepID=A0A8J7U3P6_9BACT|nr:FKBP-type peptidyl-prolyl cis-trans isomerase [Acanthopleuribacter pedis]MBO1317481.1 FKBP-type peptidyl-prolyl cis-trans isomerase [Acanthopleuribacter pedis]